MIEPLRTDDVSCALRSVLDNLTRSNQDYQSVKNNIHSISRCGFSIIFRMIMGKEKTIDKHQEQRQYKNDSI